MWEAIQANTRRSRLLIGLMAALLAGFGALVGLAFIGPDGALPGAAGALVLWLVLLVVALAGGDGLILHTAGARRIEKDDAPQLWNVVEEMSLAAGLARMPSVYIVDQDAPNAFATGRKAETAALAVTSGLLRRLNRDELQGVVAHEIAHIRNHDVRFMTLALVMVGSIALLSDMVLRMTWHGGGRRRSGGKGKGQAAAMVLTLVAALVAPLAARVLYFACSRRREYLADASAARFTRYPPGLASALEKISGNLFARPATSELRAMAPMYIVNPLSAASRGGLLSSHPPLDERVRILRAMGGRAGWVDYERAYRQVRGGGEACLDAGTLQSEGSLAAREPSAEAVEPAAGQEAAVERARGVADLLDRLAGLLLIACACGVAIKVPADFAAASIPCPRCGRSHAVPEARSQAHDRQPDPASREKAASPEEGDAAPLTYRRRGQGWESFRCLCGRAVQVSPALSASRMRCPACRRPIDVVQG